MDIISQKPYDSFDGHKKNRHLLHLKKSTAIVKFYVYQLGITRLLFYKEIQLTMNECM